MLKSSKKAILILTTLILSINLAHAKIVEVERYIDGVEYECLLDTKTQKILKCERD